MKTVLITGAALTYARPTASANRALNVARGFGANGYEPTFFDLRGEGQAAFGGVPVVQPSPAVPRGTAALAVDALVTHVGERRYDVVFVLSSPAHVVRALSERCPRAVLVYDLVEDPLGVLMNLPWRLYAPAFWRELAERLRDTWAWYRGGWAGPDVVTVISANLRTVARRVVAESATVDLPILSPPQLLPVHVGPRPPVDRHVLAYCGSLSFAKDGIATLLDAMAVLQARHVPVRLEMFGHGLRSERVRLGLGLTTRRLAETVTWRGFVSAGQLQASLAGAAALVLCKSDSRQNRFNFATRLVDYLSTGRPCIVSRVGEVATYFRHGDNALVFEAGDHRALARHIEWVISHADEADAIGRRGQALLSDAFDATRRIAEVLPYLEHRSRAQARVDPQSVARELVGTEEGLQ